MSYRIGVIDDFLNVHAFVEYKVYGELRIWNASRSSGPKPVRQQPEDAVHVFLNFEKQGCFQRRREAYDCIRRLISDAPWEAHLADYAQTLIPDC